MKLWDKLFKKKQRQREDAYQQEDEWEKVVMDRKNVDMQDADQRDKYVRSCLEQIKEASGEMEQLTFEYGVVTSYLTDMEEIEALPEVEKAELVEAAVNVVALESERKAFQGQAERMTQSQYMHMETLEDEMPEGIQKLKESEEYQVLIKQDLGRLDQEKHAFYFRREEARETIANTKGMGSISVCAMMVCFMMLVILQFGFEMDARVGYLLTAAAGALALTVLFVKHADAVKEYKRVEGAINKLILLQNRVKIRYVNNTNLLDYRFMKFGVSSSSQLKSLWERFLTEREERKRIAEASEDLDFYHKVLLGLLRRYRIKDPNIWIYQAVALVDSKEMVEIRHGLIMRRQKLRKQLDYNKDMAEKAQEEVKSLVSEYPAYAKEILGKVSEYERKQ